MFEKSIDQSTEFGLGKVVLTSTNNYLQLKVISLADDYTITNGIPIDSPTPTYNWNFRVDSTTTITALTATGCATP